MKATVYRNLAIHGVLIFVLSFILNTIIHEGAHALMGKAFGLETMMYHNYVETDGMENASLIARIMEPAAGPLMSFIQGLIFLSLLRMKKQRSLITLFYLWMSIFGFINFGGYLMMTPLFEYGDTGKVFALLNAPHWLKWLIAAVALGFLIKMILNFTKDFEHHVPAVLPEQSYLPGRLANALILFPVMGGCLVTTILSFPVPSFLSVLYPATSPFISFMIYGRLRRKREDLQGVAFYPEKLSMPLIFFVVVAVLISRLLVKGVAL